MSSTLFVRHARAGIATLVAVLVCVSTCPCPAAALDDTLWVRDGLVVAGGPSQQSYPCVLADGAGGAFISWSDDGSGTRLLRIDAFGAPVAGWPVSGVQVSAVPATLPGARLLPDGEGGVIACWLESLPGQPLSTQALWAKRFGANGVPAPGWDAVVDTARWNNIWETVADGSGGIIIAYSNPSDVTTLRVTRISATGAYPAGWAPGSVQVGGASSIYSCAVVADGAGGAFAAWSTSSVYECRLTHVGPNGSVAAGWTSQGTNLDASIHENSLVLLVADGAGGTYVSWVRTGSEPFASHFTAGGALHDGWPAGGLDAGKPLSNGLRMVGDGAGGAVLLSAGLNHVRAQRLVAAGLAPNWPADGVQLHSEFAVVGGLVSGGAATYFAHWNSDRNGHSVSCIMAFDSTGALVAGWPTEGVLAPVEAPWTSLGPLSGEGCVYAWTDYRGGSQDIRAMRILADGIVSVLATLVDAVAVESGVRVRWQCDRAGAVFDVERRGGEQDWAPIAAGISPDGVGRISFEDRDVIPGVRYGYRLAFVEGGVRATIGEAWVQAGGKSGFALARYESSPGSVRVTVECTLPDAGIARLALFDVGGRTCRSEVVNGPGVHLVELSPPGDLPPGLYFVRLTQGVHSAVVRVSVVR